MLCLDKVCGVEGKVAYIYSCKTSLNCIFRPTHDLVSSHESLLYGRLQRRHFQGCKLIHRFHVNKSL